MHTHTQSNNTKKKPKIYTASIRFLPVQHIFHLFFCYIFFSIYLDQDSCNTLIICRCARPRIAYMLYKRENHDISTKITNFPAARHCETKCADLGDRSSSWPRRKRFNVTNQIESSRIDRQKPIIWMIWAENVSIEVSFPSERLHTLTHKPISPYWTIWFVHLFMLLISFLTSANHTKHFS